MASQNQPKKVWQTKTKKQPDLFYTPPKHNIILQLIPFYFFLFFYLLNSFFFSSFSFFFLSSCSSSRYQQLTHSHTLSIPPKLPYHNVRFQNAHVCCRKFYLIFFLIASPPHTNIANSNNNNNFNTNTAGQFIWYNQLGYFFSWWIWEQAMPKVICANILLFIEDQ